MPTGRGTSETGGVLAPADVRGAGDMEWASVIGVPPGHPLVSDAGPAGYNIAASHSRIVTTPAGQAGPAGGVLATPNEYALEGGKHIDDWRDILNFKGSPVPWMLLIALGVLLFAHASIQARAGAFGKTASARAALE